MLELGHEKIFTGFKKNVHEDFDKEQAADLLRFIGDKIAYDDITICPVI